MNKIEFHDMRGSVPDRSEQMVRLTGLSSALRGRAWNEIKRTNPALADLLREEMVQKMIKKFNADLYVSCRWAPCLKPSDKNTAKSG